jgi:hypothetical protein
VHVSAEEDGALRSAHEAQHPRGAISENGLRARRSIRREAAVNGVDVIARGGGEIVVGGVEERRTRREGILVGPNDRKRGRRHRRLIIIAIATRATARHRGGWPGGVVVRVGLVIEGGALLMDIIATGCPSGGCAAAQSGRDEEGPESRC